MTDDARTRQTNAGLAARRWQPRPYLRADLPLFGPDVETRDSATPMRDASAEPSRHEQEPGNETR